VISSMEERMALPPAMRGQLPRGAKAAKMVELLQEAADAVQQPVLSDIADGWAEFYQKVLDLMDRHYSDARMVAILGPDKRADVMEFKSGTLPRDWHDRLLVRVEAGESMPSSRLARMQFVLELARAHGMFGQPGTPEYQRRLREALDLDAGFISVEGDLDQAIADEENGLLLQGQQIAPNAIDNHLIHLAGSHLPFAKRMIAAGKKEVLQALMPHIQAHQQALLQQQQQMAAMQSQKPGGPGQQKPGGPQGGGGGQGEQQGPQRPEPPQVQMPQQPPPQATPVGIRR